ncbi:MAG: glutamate--tRNA ligase [Candidatus Cloacimonetes bacterium HGW-Cloacimonetes-1]|jgi:glutamyl-tRNA synthetase|nr:MAG: glutamate--tRNA ligase [Candidatus Cloacimonetes bacterium HGW-Cloacimonetes-1]
MKETRVRFAPSPTGYLHIGGLRTALYDFLFAKKYNGKFVLRIEDTDRNRLVEGAVENLISSLTQLDLIIDEGPHTGGEYGPYVQSERLELYHQHADLLLKSGHAYHCFCSSETLDTMRLGQQERKEFVKYDRRCLQLSAAEVSAKLAANETHVIRLKMPDEHKFRFDDLIRGTVEMDAAQSDDQVIVKSDGFPTYHLAAVVDDHFMQISHVIRGEEWLSSTPKHIWLYQCLGWEAPIWIHLPLILNTDRSKLSKRMNDVSVESYIQKGYLKEALINFIALLGWHASEDREIYTLEELCQEFSIERVSKSGAVFDLTKLDWMNGQYIRSLPLDTIAERCHPYFESSGIDTSDHVKLLKIIDIARERITLLPEIVEYSKIFYLTKDLDAADQDILDNEISQTVLKWFLESVQANLPLDRDKVHKLVSDGMAALQIKGKNYYTPLRLALIGQAHGPDMPATFDILGDAEVILRLGRAIR